MAYARREYAYGRYAANRCCLREAQAAMTIGSARRAGRRARAVKR